MGKALWESHGNGNLLVTKLGMGMGGSGNVKSHSRASLVYTNFGFSDLLVFELRDAHTDGRTDGRAELVMRPVRTAAQQYEKQRINTDECR